MTCTGVASCLPCTRLSSFLDFWLQRRFGSFKKIQLTFVPSIDTWCFDEIILEKSNIKGLDFVKINSYFE